jgi:hypothetical protein
MAQAAGGARQRARTPVDKYFSRFS